MPQNKFVKVTLISREDGLLLKLKKFFQDKGYCLELAQTWKDALETFYEEESNLIIYDLGTSDYEKVAEICQIRLRFQGPLIILMSEDNPDFNLLALELGADDCLCRSAPGQLITAKVMSLLRREQLSRPGKGSRVVLGKLVVDTGYREVRLAGKPVELTTIEYDLLCFLVCNMGSVVSRDDIHQALYHAEYDGLNRSIDLYISRLRKKLGDDPVAPRFLKTVRGAGYLLVDGMH